VIGDWNLGKVMTEQNDKDAACQEGWRKTLSEIEERKHLPERAGQPEEERGKTFLESVEEQLGKDGLENSKEPWVITAKKSAAHGVVRD
jgi:hypothetical protein